MYWQYAISAKSSDDVDEFHHGLGATMARWGEHVPLPKEMSGRLARQLERLEMLSVDETIRKAAFDS
jgi:hypothetical protein